MAMSNDQRSVCGSCDKNISEKDSAMLCEGFCNMWYHIGCVEISITDYDVLHMLSDKIVWYCAGCKVKVNSLLKVNMSEEKISTDNGLERNKEENGYNELYSQCIKQAICYGNLDIIVKFINDKAILNKFANGHPRVFHEILRSAITVNRDSRTDNVFEAYDFIILQLIEAAKNVHFGFFDGKTLLLEALRNHLSYTIIDELIKAGSDINACSVDQETPLACALNEGYDKDIIIELIERGANVDCRDGNGWTPLFYGMHNHYDCPDFITMLLDAGSNIHDLDDTGNNVLLIDGCNCFAGHDCRAKESIDLLLKYGINNTDLKHTDNEGNTILHTTACKYLFELAIKSGISVDAKNNKGQTPLLKEVWSLYEKKLVYLINSGANVNCTDEKSRTLLHLWNWNRGKKEYPYMIYRHIYYGGDLYARDIYNQTPLENLIDNFDHYFNEHHYIIIKHVFLFEDNEYDTRKKDLEKLCKSGILSSYLVQVKNELKLLRETFVADGITFYDFCILKRYYKSKCVNIPLDKYNYDYEEIFEIIPCFSYLIIIRIKDNRLKKCKIDLRKRFEKITLSTVQSMETDFHEVLNYDCLYHICRYLNYKEMFNVFSAAVEC